MVAAAVDKWASKFAGYSILFATTFIEATGRKQKPLSSGRQDYPPRHSQQH